MADGEQSYLLCNQMWPDDQWPTNMWPEDQWPVYCELIYVHNGCVIDIGVNLINEFIEFTNLIESVFLESNLITEFTDRLFLVNSSELPLNLFSEIIIPAQVTSSYRQDLSLVNLIDFHTMISDPLVPINLIGESYLTTNLKTGDIMDTNIIDGYNIYINICVDGDCNCGE